MTSPNRSRTPLFLWLLTGAAGCTNHAAPHAEDARVVPMTDGATLGPDTGPPPPSADLGARPIDAGGRDAAGDRPLALDMGPVDFGRLHDAGAGDADVAAAADAGAADAGEHHGLAVRICGEMCPCNGHDPDLCPIDFLECLPYNTRGIDVGREECTYVMEHILDVIEAACNRDDECACRSLQECVAWESTAVCEHNMEAYAMVAPAVCVGGIPDLNPTPELGLCFHESLGSYSACRMGIDPPADAGVPPP